MLTDSSRGPPSRCPECGGPLDRTSTDGLCPFCLLDGANGPDETPAEALESKTIDTSGSLLPIRGYVVLDEVARGGMGIVYRARQQSPSREVALKMLLPTSASSAELRERFQLETRTLSELDHPAILPIYETGELDGLPWFTMKLAAGGSLAERLATYAGRGRDVAELVATLADAVQFAHDHGVLHRDLKPGNILFAAAERPYVADFGLAKLVESTADLTVTRRVLGTPHYLAPEVAANNARHATTASDVYSLGAILYELLSGHPPFTAEGLPALLRKIAEEEPEPPRKRMQKEECRMQNSPRGSTSSFFIPPSAFRDLEVITLKCLAKDPARRYASARELAAELRRFLAGEPILARPVGGFEKFTNWCRRRPALAASLGACAVIALAGLAGVLWQLRQTERARDHAERSERVMRENLYAADMLGASRALEQDDLGTARLLLEAHRPATGQEDVRGFEWRYLWARTRPQSTRTLRIRDREVSALQLSPDATRLAVGGGQLVLLYDTATWQVIGRAIVHGTQSADFARDGRQLYLGSRRNGVVRRWDLPSIETPPPVLVPTAVELSATGRAGVLPLPTTEEWERNGFASPRTVLNSPPPVLVPSRGRWPNVVVSPRGDVLAIGAGGDIDAQTEGWAAVYSTNGTRLHELPGSGRLVAFSPDGEQLATGSWQGTIKLWRPATGELLKVLTNAVRVVALRFSPDGSWLVASSLRDGCWLFDPATGAQRPVARGHHGSVWTAAISPDGKTLATGGADQTVRLWNLATGEQTTRLLGHSYTVIHTVWMPDGRTLITGGMDGTVRLWDTAQPQTSDMPAVGFVRPRHFSGNGRWLLSERADGRLDLLEYPALKLHASAGRLGLPLGFLPGDQSFLTWTQPSNQPAKLVEYSVPGLQPVRTQLLSNSIGRLTLPTLSPDGRWLAVGTETRMVRLIARTEPSREFTLHITNNTGLLSLAFSPDSRVLAISVRDITDVHLRDVATGAALPALHGHEAFIRHLVFSRDGEQLISADGDKFIKVWDWRAARALATFKGHRAGISALDLDATGRTIVSAASDGMLRFWHVRTGRELLRQDLPVTANGVTFSPDGTRLFIRSPWVGTNAPSTLVWHAPNLAEIAGAPQAK